MEQLTPSDRRPALRHLDVSQVDRDGQPGVVLSDPLGISDQQVFVPQGLLPIVSRFDGTRTLEGIEAELTAEANQALPAGLVGGIADQLSACNFLDTEQFRETLRRMTAAFTAQAARPSAHAGVSAGYPAAAVAARAALESMVRRPPATTALRPAPRGLVAPHIDLMRGREGYSMAYGALAECHPADLYVVFGTGHQGPRATVTGLPMDWDTPIGAMRTDRAFVAEIHDRVGAADPADLFLHRHEHSIEFQMLFLKHVVGDHACEVAGFLTGPLPTNSTQVTDSAAVQQLLTAFRKVCTARQQAGQRVCFIAGADLAHIGPEFGDRDPIDSARLDRLAREEKARLAHLERGEPAAFHRAIEQDGNPDRICGTTPMFLTASLAGGAGRLLHYGQANAPGGELTVSFCGMLFE